MSIEYREQISKILDELDGYVHIEINNKRFILSKRFYEPIYKCGSFEQLIRTANLYINLILHTKNKQMARKLGKQLNTIYMVLPDQYLGKLEYRFYLAREKISKLSTSKKTKSGS